MHAFVRKHKARRQVNATPGTQIRTTLIAIPAWYMPLYNDLKRSPFVEALTIIANDVSSVWLSLTFNAYVPLGCGLSSGYEALATRVFIERSQSTFWKGRGGCSESLGRRSIDTFFRRSCVSIHHHERINFTLRLDPRTCRDQHWHWTNCTVTRRSKAPLDRSKHIPVLRASDGLEFLFSLDLRVNHDLTFLYFTRFRLTRFLTLLPVFIVFFFSTNLINKFMTFYKNIYLCYDLNIYI